MYNYYLREKVKKRFPNILSPFCNSERVNKEFKDGDEYWACAYETNDTEKSMGLRAKPVLGVVKLEGTDFKFYPYGKNGTPLKSKKINLSGRVYAKTEQESIEVYNFFVDEQIALLEELLANAKADRI